MNAFLDRLNMRDLLAFMLLSGILSLAFILAFKAPDTDVFKMMLGGLLTTGFAGVIAWYFGSSSGSAMKDEALAKTATAQTETIAKTAAAQTETIAVQGQALAQSVPAQTTTTSVDAQAGTAETVTEPAKPEGEKK